MAEQIVELRKWVSNPNGGKTDKVSVLQDAVSYVKDASRRIQVLNDMLQRSRAECAHLRHMLSSTAPSVSIPSSSVSNLQSNSDNQFPSPPAIAPPSHSNTRIQANAQIHSTSVPMPHVSSSVNSVLESAGNERIENGRAKFSAERCRSKQ